MKNFYILIIVAILSLTQQVLANPKISAKTSILVDFHTDEILFSNEPDLSIYPASMTKIMTSIIAFDLLKNNKISLDDEYTISEKAWRLSQSGYSSMFIMINDQVSVEDLLQGIIVASGNDACIALAEGIAGTEENFVEMMNEKASEIGMTNTNFDNSSGINSAENYSTVRDIALMSKYLIKNYPGYYEYFAQKTYTWDRTGGDPITQGNRNPLLYKNIGVDGIKTGYLAVEKYSLASSMKKDTRRLIAVGSGFETKNSRSNQSLRLLSWGFRNTDTFLISEANKTYFNIKTWLGKNETINGITKEDVYITLSKKDSNKLKVVVDYKGPIKAPIKKEQKVADLKIYIKDKLIKTVAVYSAEEIKKVNFLQSLFYSLNYMIWGDV